MFEPPKNYNEMLPKLHKATFLNTLIYCILLVIYEYIPLITLPTKYVPPIKDHESFINWALSFGILPCAFAIFAHLISGALDLHNNAAKLLRVRYLWDKHLIIKPLSRRAGVNRKLNKDEAHNVMSNLYYPEVRKIEDKHYIELFWNKVYYFWIFFEFSIIALISFLIIFFCKQMDIFHVEGSLLSLFFFVILSFSVSGIIFALTVKPRTESQVEKIPDDKIKEFFTKNNIN